jgi:LacI family transcriptional regulator
LGITIYDIAERAGVSIATVSRVFNAKPRVSKETRETVLRVAEELGYQPHASARSLARRQTETISAVIPMISNNFFAEVLKGLQDRMSTSTYDLLVFSAPTLEDVRPLLEKAMHRGRSAGVLLFSAPVQNGMEVQMSKGGQPVVLVDSYHHAFDSISTDNRRGGTAAAEFILSSDVQRPVVLMASPDSIPASQRLEGFRSTYEASGRTFSPDMVSVASRSAEFDGFSEACGYSGMKEFLKRDEKPDAVFATSDIQAIGAMQAVREAGLNVPEDIQIIGFDDLPMSRHLGLTTLRQPMHDIGSRAFDLLIERIQRPDTPVAHTVFAPSLIERQTTRRETVHNLETAS